MAGPQSRKPRTGVVKKKKVVVRRRRARPGLLALKVKAKWLLRMQTAKDGFSKPKRVEVRAYRPDVKHHLPPGREAPRKGERIFLTSTGAVWGSARFMGVRPYRSVRSFDEDAALHQVTPKTAHGGGDLSYASVKAKLKELKSERGGLFGWMLSDFRWHPRNKQPRAQGFWQGDRIGMVKVPDFSGMQEGMVWYRGGTLPVALEPKAVSVTHDEPAPRPAQQQQRIGSSVKKGKGSFGLRMRKASLGVRMKPLLRFRGTAPRGIPRRAADPIKFEQSNPKAEGSASHRRYAKYKIARTLQKAFDLGALAVDITNDYQKGFLKRRQN